jgi:hypothetical protein
MANAVNVSRQYSQIPITLKAINAVILALMADTTSEWSRRAVRQQFG